jgi:hypothetical protein
VAWVEAEHFLAVQGQGEHKLPSPCTVSGTLSQLSSALVGQGKVLFQLTNIGTGNPIGVTGTTIIPSLTYTAVTSVNGTFSISLWGNDNITPANTVYSCTFFDSLGNSMGPVLYSITGATFNLNTAVAVSNILPPVFVPTAIVSAPTTPQTITGQSLTLTSSAPLIIQGSLNAIQFPPTVNMAGIQAAHDALPSGGGWIILADVTYNGTATVAFTKPVILQGAGKDVTIVQLTTTGSVLHAFTSTKSLVVRDLTIQVQTPPASNLTMEGIRMDTTGGTTASGLQLEVSNVRVTGFNGGIFADGRLSTLVGYAFDRITIRNVDALIAGTGSFIGECIFASGATVVSIENCTLDNNSVGDHTIYAINVKNIFVHKNLMRNTAGVSAAGVKLAADNLASSQLLDLWSVEDNAFINLSNPVLIIPGRVTGDNPILAKVIIRGNKIQTQNSTNTGDYGIHITPINSSTIRTLEITDNYMDDLQLGGILLDGATGASIAEVVTISDLTIRNWSKFNSGTYSAISNNSVAPISNLVINNIRADGVGTGRNAYGLTTSVITRLQIGNISEVNTSNPSTPQTFPQLVSGIGFTAFNPPPVASTTDLGTTLLPFGNIFLGTAATNNLKLQPAATAAARVISMPDPLAAVNMPYVIANGSSTLTSNATLAAVTSQAAITTAAANALTTDSIEWCYATAPGAGDSLCHVSAYVTAGNVNFVRTNPTAASQNVSAIVLNWRVIR